MLQLKQYSHSSHLECCLLVSLSWSEHITAVCTKTSKRLYFLMLLKLSGMTSDDLLYYYNLQDCYPPSDRVRVCCLAFKYHSWTARPTGGNTAVSSSDYLWQKMDFDIFAIIHEFHYLQTDAITGMHDSSHCLHRLLYENSVESAINKINKK